MRTTNLRVGLLAAVTVLLLAAVVLVAPVLLHPPLPEASLRGIPPRDRIQLQQEQAKLQESARLLLLQGLGGFLLLAGAVATWRQVQVSREGQITDRFSRAIDQLGSDKLDVRLGGVHALERIAHNSPDDRPAIAEILTAFIRGHAPYPQGSPEHRAQHPSPEVEQLLWLRDRGLADVQAAITVLGRRPTTPGDGDMRLELSMVDLRSAYLTRANLAGARIRHANLARAWMHQTRLDHADLKDTDLRRSTLAEADLTGANLEQAHLDGARLHQARLRGARLPGAHLRGADLRETDLRETDLRNADLTGADLTGADLHGADLYGCRADPSTRWPEGFDPGGKEPTPAPQPSAAHAEHPDQPA